MSEERWEPIEDFPSYEVSNLGRVRHTRSGNIKGISLNQQGISNVHLAEPTKYRRRSVALLVAKAFLPEPSPHYSSPTPIHRDGDKQNCRADNLMWRPRWFAVNYHQMFDMIPRHPEWLATPASCITTGDDFESVMDCCVTYGVLAWDVMDAMRNHDLVWPDGLEFELV